MMKKLIYICIFSGLLFSSCRSYSRLPLSLPPHISAEDSIRMANTKITIFRQRTGYKGISRLKTYEFAHPDVPVAFDGFRMAFVSDLHYKSLFKEKGLDNLVKLLKEQHADVLLVGGDLHEGCEYVPSVIAALAAVKPPMGVYAVLGNNDYEACYDEIVREMRRCGVHLLEHKVDTLRRNGEEIQIAGVRNPFDLKKNGTAPTLALSPEDFVVLLTHTPDYAEDVPVTHADLVLAGHTHGGQVTLFGWYAPILPSHYGQRFRTGVRYNSMRTPMIITNGIGTSNRNVRLFAPSEAVMIILRRAEVPRPVSSFRPSLP